MKSSICAAVLAALLSVAAGPASAQSVGMGVSAPGSFYNTVGSVLAGVAAEKGGIDIRTQPFSAANVYLPAVGSGELDFGLANVIETGLALSGGGFYKGKSYPDLRVVAAVAPMRVAFFVKKDSPIKTITDFKGHKVPGGFAQQKVVKLLNDAHFKAVGLSAGDMSFVPVPNVSRGADDFMAGRTDIMFFALGSGKVTEVDAAVGGIRAVALPDTPDVRSGLKKTNPQFYVRMEKPQKGLTGIAEPTTVLAFDALLLANANTSEDVVYKMTKALYENAVGIAKASKALSNFSQDEMAKDLSPMIYHPGAVKFYKEAGVWPGN